LSVKNAEIRFVNSPTKVTVDGRPATPHELMYLLLHMRLHRACPSDLAILVLPWEIRSHFDEDAQQHTKPKILVVPVIDFDDEKPPRPPVLAIELLDPTCTLNAKKQAYARRGVRSYWVVDPLEPSLTAFELGDDGQYQTAASITGDEPFEPALPFPVRIVLTEPLGTGRVNCDNGNSSLDRGTP
jgi:hypothetical protein